MKYDLTVIGSGPGGYIAAIRASQLGLKTAIVEKYSTLGGTCLNVGCIPSKALLDSSEHYYNASHSFELHGIKLKDLKVDMPQMLARKNDVVVQTTKGIEFLMKKNKIDVFQGTGSFLSATKIQIAKSDNTNEVIESTNIIIATGSKPIMPPNFNYDKKRVITSTEALNLDSIPKQMVVVGGGVIGLELGSVYARLGTQVHVIEFADRIIATMDNDCSKELTKSLKNLGIQFHTGHMVTAVTPSANSVKVDFKKINTEEILSINADYCLVAIGRKPYTEGLGLDKIGVELDEKGRIKTDVHLRTNITNIFAIGDVIQGAMLAHKAEEEGVYVAEFLSGQKPHINYNLIPGVVYTWPEVSSVGQTEEQLKSSGIEYKVGKFPFKALGRARASNDLDGLVKVIADKKTDEILGVHMVGARAADLIAEAVALMEFRASAEDASRMSHAHPTFAEAFKEAALAATDNRPLNI
jgi:dihydrolipoamide dehydrogenase